LNHISRAQIPIDNIVFIVIVVVIVVVVVIVAIATAVVTIDVFPNRRVGSVITAIDHNGS